MAKGDDDAFVHAHQYLVDLHKLPRQNVYWGNIWLNLLGDPYYVASGLLYTLSKDMAKMLVAYEPIWPLIRKPYSWRLRRNLTLFRMENEDIMVGRVLSLATDDSVTIVVETCCRFHAIDRKQCDTPLRNNFVVIHGVSEEDYARMLDRYSNNKQLVPMEFVQKGKRLLAQCQPPLLRQGTRKPPSPFPVMNAVVLFNASHKSDFFVTHVVAS